MKKRGGGEHRLEVAYGKEVKCKCKCVKAEHLGEGYQGVKCEGKKSAYNA